MAQEASEPQQHMAMTEEQRLKYLEFVQVAAIHSVMCFYNLYSQAKEKSGPLRSGVETIEGTVKTVVGPLYDKFHDVPIEFLKYVDNQVDKSVNELDRRVPPVIKQVSSQAFSTARKAPDVAREVKRAGVVDTASGIAKSMYSKYEPTAKELYTKYEPIAEQTVVSAWHKLNKLPLFPQVAQVVVPTAAYYSEKYNDTVRSSAEKGYRVSSFLPLVPTQRIAKVFGNESSPAIAE